MTAPEIVLLIFLAALLLSLALCVVYVNLTGAVPLRILAMVCLSSVFLAAQYGVTFR